MLGWLDRFWHGVTGTVGNAVSSATHWAMHALASVVFSVFHLVGGAWNTLVDGIVTFHRGLDEFGHSVYEWATYIWRHVIPSILKWATTEFKKLEAYAKGIYNYLLGELHKLETWAIVQFAKLSNWVIHSVWDPLKAYAQYLWGRIKAWAYVAWYWITHPAALADYLIFHIAASMEKYAWQLASQLGKFALSLITANAGKIALLIEDIITAVF